MIRVDRRYLIFLLLALVLLYIEGETMGYTIIYILILPFIYELVFFVNIKKSIGIRILNEKKVYVCGDEDVFDFYFTNKGILLIPYIEFYNRGISTIDRAYIGEFLTLGIGKEILLTYNLSFHKRGIYNIGNFQYKAKGLFGFVTFTGFTNKKYNIKIYPKVYSLNPIIFNGYKFFDNIGADKKMEDPYSTREMRLYREGDSIKKINWKVSAKQGELFVKVSDRIFGEDVMLFLDMSKDNYMLDHKGEKEERLIDFSLSLVSTLVNDKTVCHINISNEISQRFIIENAVQLNDFKEYLVENDSRGDGDFNEFISDYSGDVNKSKVVCILASSIRDDIYETLLRLNKNGIAINLFYNNNLIEESKINKLTNLGISSFVIDEILYKD